MQLTHRKRYPVLPFRGWVAYSLLIPALVGVGIWAVLPEIVPAGGVLEPEHFLVLRASRSGVLAHSLLEETRLVRAGELLYQIDPRETETERAHLEREYRNARLHLQTLQRELVNRRNRTREAEELFSQRQGQMRSLVDLGLKSGLDLELARLTHVREQESDQRQINELEKEALALGAQAEHLRRKMADLEVEARQHGRYAPWDGYVLAGLPLHPLKPFLGAPTRRGDFLEAGRVLGFFGKASTLALRLSLPDAYRDRIEEGQVVSWSPAGYPHSRYREIRGRLMRIEAAPEPGFFWGLVVPDPQSLAAFLDQTKLRVENLWGMGVHARLEVPHRPIWDRLGDR